MEEIGRGATATIDRPAVNENAPRSTHVQATLDLARALPIGERRAFVQWVRLLRRRGYPLSMDPRLLQYGALIAERLRVPEKDIADDMGSATGLAVSSCDDCAHLLWSSDTREVCNGDRSVCAACQEESYFRCDCCRDWHSTEDRYRVRGTGYVCEGCLNEYYGVCEGCGSRFHNDDLYNDGGDYSYCESCRPEEHRSDCEARHPRFTFPALCTPAKSVQNDEVIPVTVGSGEVSAQGMHEVRRTIYKKTGGLDLTDDLAEFDSAWQAKEGNFPKRLAKHLLTARSLKLSDELMAECGNVAKAHTSKVATQYVSLTRDLNGDPDEFLNESSCWWGEYSRSRCELKARHGFGIRGWSAQVDGYPTSRAWLMPLRVTDGRIDRNPVHELPADAYVLFNAYGDLEQLAFARIVAGMTGKSYRKLEGFEVADMYVNAAGVLIAEQSICDSVREITLGAVSQCGCPGG